MFRVIFLLSFSILSLISCGPVFVPNPDAIVNQWDVRRNTQNTQEPYLYTTTRNARLNRITLRLLRAAEIRGIILAVDPSQEWNAAMESIKKLMIVNQGLIDQTPSDDELAAVLAHEIGHYIYHHSQAKVSNHNQQIALLRDVAGTAKSRDQAIRRAELAYNLSNALVYMPQSREYEFQADSFSVFLLHRAGYDPGAAIRIWWKKHLEMKSLGKQFNLLDTHPMSDERVLNLMRTIAVFTNE